LALANSSASLRNLASSASYAALAVVAPSSGSYSPWVSNVDGFNSSSRDDEAPLVELAVVLFFLVDILGLLLKPSTNGGHQLLWGSEATFHKQ
jgi:hypothetical protein